MKFTKMHGIGNDYVYFFQIHAFITFILYGMM